MTRSASETARPPSLSQTTKTLRRTPMAATDSYDFIVIGCGAAGLSAALSCIAAAKEQGRKPRVAVLESAPAKQRGGATRWTTARFRAREDFSLDPLFVAKVGKLSKGLADLDYCRVLEREVPETLRLLEAHGVKLLHFGPPVAMGVEHEITPDGGGKAIVEALASSLEKTGAAEILYRTEAVRLSLADDGRVEGVVVRGEDGLLRTVSARARPAVARARIGLQSRRRHHNGDGDRRRHVGAVRHATHRAGRPPHVEARCLYLRSSVRHRRQRERRALL